MSSMRMRVVEDVFKYRLGLNYIKLPLFDFLNLLKWQFHMFSCNTHLLEMSTFKNR